MDIHIKDELIDRILDWKQIVTKYATSKECIYEC